VDRARKGTAKAWQAVSNPRPGTMLSIFDALVDFCRKKLSRQ